MQCVPMTALIHLRRDGAVASPLVMPSYSMFILPPTFARLFGVRPPTCGLASTNDCLASFRRATFGFPCSIRPLSLGTGRVFAFFILAKARFQFEWPFGRRMTYHEARVLWFQYLLGTKIPRSVAVSPCGLLRRPSRWSCGHKGPPTSDRSA